MVFENYLAASKAFEVTRAVTRLQAKVTSQEPEVVWEAEPPLPEEEEMENTPAQTITTTERPLEVDRPRKRRGQREPIPRRTGGSRQSKQVLVRLSTPHERSNRSSE